jgi:hypothetical protein
MDVFALLQMLHAISLLVSKLTSVKLFLMNGLKKCQACNLHLSTCLDTQLDSMVFKQIMH